MVESDESQVIDAIQAAIAELGFSERPIQLRPLPFNGSFGYASTIAVQLAAEALPSPDGETNGLARKEGKPKDQALVQREAQALAEQIAARLLERNLFSQVEAVRGSVNVYLAPEVVADDVIRRILSAGPQYGMGQPRPSQVMIAYAQPSTHKPLAIGHLRGLALAGALASLMRFSGYAVTTADYVGDVGPHVIKCLWCYRSFHQGQEPATGRGRWLSQLHTEADARLRYRENIVQFIQDMSAEGYFRPYADRLAKELWQRKALGEDVAYMLGQISNEPRLDIRKLRDPDALRVFFDLIGPWLRDQVQQGKVPEARLTQWQQLHARLDWWAHVPDWERTVKETTEAWERHDEALLALWRETRQWSLDDLHALYRGLGVEFDVSFFESDLEEPARALVQELLDRGIAEISDGLPSVKIDEQLGLEREKYGTLPILRSDGTAISSTKSLALVKTACERYPADRSIYVMDVRQSPHLQQVFKVLELEGLPQAKQCHYLGYEVVAMPESAMNAPQAGALFERLVDEALRRARALVAAESAQLTEEQQAAISHHLAIGSLKYYMLSRDQHRAIVFDWDEALNLDGQTAPAIQRAHARAYQLLAEAGASPAAEDTFALADITPAEVNLLQTIARFPAEVARAADAHSPHVIATYLAQVSRAFTDWCEAHPIAEMHASQRTARLSLIAATRQVLANGLALLGIAAPTVM